MQFCSFWNSSSFCFGSSSYIDSVTTLSLSHLSVDYLYADNLLLYRSISSPDEFELVQADISAIAQWSSQSYLILNSSKCKYMVISRKRTPPTPIHLLMPNDQVLQQVSSYKYLGILLTSDLSLSAHINLKVRRIVGLLYRQFSNASSHTIVILYTSLVKPHLEYACPVWSPHLAKDINALEKVQGF